MSGGLSKLTDSIRCSNLNSPNTSNVPSGLVSMKVIISVYACKYVCMCVCMYICMYVGR